MRRTGNHIIINWLRNHCSDSVFYNNIKLKKPVPDSRFPDIDPSQKPNVFVSYEEYNLDIPSDSHFDNLGIFNKRYNIIILRDVFNLFASRLKHKGLRRETLIGKKKFIRMWKNYAKEFLGDTNNVPDKLCINYNKWFSSFDYRRNLEKSLGFELCDDGLDDVPVKGHGSSFDGKKFDGMGRYMKVKKRWKNMVSDKKYVSLFNDDLISLNDRIFGNLISSEFIKCIK